MPLYDYACDGCKGRFELSHGMSEPAVTKCPSCGQEKMRKVLTTGGLMGADSGKGQAAPPMSSPCGGGGCSGGMCGM